MVVGRSWHGKPDAAACTTQSETFGRARAESGSGWNLSRRGWTSMSQRDERRELGGPRSAAKRRLSGTSTGMARQTFCHWPRWCQLRDWRGAGRSERRHWQAVQGEPHGATDRLARQRCSKRKRLRRTSVQRPADGHRTDDHVSHPGRAHRAQSSPGAEVRAPRITVAAGAIRHPTRTAQHLAGNSCCWLLPASRHQASAYRAGRNSYASCVGGWKGHPQARAASWHAQCSSQARNSVCFATTDRLGRAFERMTFLGPDYTIPAKRVLPSGRDIWSPPPVSAPGPFVPSPFCPSRRRSLTAPSALDAESLLPASASEGPP